MTVPRTIHVLAAMVTLMAVPLVEADQLKVQVGRPIDNTATAGPISDSLSGSHNEALKGFSFANAASADYGILGAASSLTLRNALADEIRTGAGAAWDTTYAFTSADGSAIPVSLNFDLTGSILFSNHCGDGRGGCEFSIDMAGGAAGIANLLASDGVLTRAGGWLAPVASQFKYDGSRFTVHLTTDTFFVRGDGVPIGLGISFQIGLHEFVNGDDVSIEADFLDPFNFPVGGLAFNLPAGATVVGPGLSDNCFGGPAACGLAPPVPEPATFALLASGMALLVGSRRRAAAARRDG